MMGGGIGPRCADAVFTTARVTAKPTMTRSVEIHMNDNLMMAYESGATSDHTRVAVAALGLGSTLGSQLAGIAAWSRRLSPTCRASCSLQKRACQSQEEEESHRVGDEREQHARAVCRIAPGRVQADTG